MTHWLLALVLALTSAVPAYAQEEGDGGEGGGEQQMSEGQEGGEQGGDQSGGEQGGDQSGGEQGADQSGGEQGADQSGGEQGGEQGGQQQQGEGEVSVEPVESSGGSNIVGDIAADDGEEEMSAPRPKPRKAKISKKKPAGKATKARLSRRRRAAANPVGTQTAPTADAEPQFPELDLPELKEAVAKKEPAPPAAPLVPLPLMFP